MGRNIYFLTSGYLFLAAVSTAQTFHPQIPKAWDDRDVASFEVPLAEPDRSPRYLNAAEYYALEVAPIYRTYPVYAPGKGPAGYLDSLKEKEPEVVFDAAKLRTEQDWIRAGELVFDSPTRIAPAERVNIIRPDFLRDVPLNMTHEGVIPYIRYVVREKGVVELGVQSCGFCHSRVLPDGTVLKGAQGNFPGEQRNAWALRQQADSPERDRRARLDEWTAFEIGRASCRERV